MTTGFQLRAPWYDRERRNFDLRDPRALPPVIQMYDDTDFVDKLVADPADSLSFTRDDRWSYPYGVKPGPGASGREKFITSKLAYTRMRKLYQPSHSRFYVVVVEVFCDQPGLPRAGSHSDLKVFCVMRRRHIKVAAPRGAVRRLSRVLLTELAKEQHALEPAAALDLDVTDVWWGGPEHHERFEDDHADLLAEVSVEIEEQGWMPAPAGNEWHAIGADPDDVAPPDGEERIPMWRLPAPPGVCEAATTRSLWFGLVPTYSSDHWTDADGKLVPKLDDHAVYQLRCVVQRPPELGHEQCPPKYDVSEPTRPFRLAAAYDPDGTKNRTISVTAPDLRRLAARAGQQQGPGGLRITTPPNSSLSPIDFKKIPGAGLGSPTTAGAICTFAFELFFIVAFFLFLLFLPIVVLAFQLWWMLALRFCIPPSLSFSLLADFFAAGHVLADLKVGAGFPTQQAAFDEVIGIPNAATALLSGGDFAADPSLADDLVAGIDPSTAITSPVPRPHLPTPPDPLCPKP
jgi:hypothetical protein